MGTNTHHVSPHPHHLGPHFQQHNARVRESQPVPRYSKEDVWKAVAEGIVYSTDLDGRFVFDPNEEPRLPCVSNEQMLPYQRQTLLRRDAATPPAHPREHSVPRSDDERTTVVAGAGMGASADVADVAIATLAREIGNMEAANAALRRLAKRQGALVGAFCALHVQPD